MLGFQFRLRPGQLGLLGQEPLLLDQETLLLTKRGSLLRPQPRKLGVVRVGRLQLGDGPVQLGQAAVDLGEAAVDLGEAAVDLIEATVDLCQQPVHLANAALHLRDDRLQLAENVPPRHRPEIRQPTVVVDEIKPELRHIQRLGKIPCRKPKLAIVTGSAVRAARNRRRT